MNPEWSQQAAEALNSPWWNDIPDGDGYLEEHTRRNDLYDKLKDVAQNGSGPEDMPPEVRQAFDEAIRSLREYEGSETVHDRCYADRIDYKPDNPHDLK